MPAVGGDGINGGINGWQRAGYISTATTTSTSAVDLGTFSGLGILVTQPIMIVGAYGKDASAAQAVQLGLSINGTAVIEASSNNIAASSGTQRAEDGTFFILITPRTAATLTGISGWSNSRVSSSGAQATNTGLFPGNFSYNALIPNATITSIAIRGINATTSNNLFISGVYLYVGV